MIDTENDQCLTSDICVFVYLFVVCDGQGWSLIGDCLLSDRFGLLLARAPRDKKNTSW